MKYKQTNTNKYKQIQTNTHKYTQIPPTPTPPNPIPPPSPTTPNPIPISGTAVVADDFDAGCPALELDLPVA